MITLLLLLLFMTYLVIFTVSSLIKEDTKDIYIYVYIKEGGEERENQKEAKIINRYCSVFELKYNSNL